MNKYYNKYFTFFIHSNCKVRRFEPKMRENILTIRLNQDELNIDEEINFLKQKIGNNDIKNEENDNPIQRNQSEKEKEEKENDFLLLKRENDEKIIELFLKEKEKEREKEKENINHIMQSNKTLNIEEHLWNVSVKDSKIPLNHNYQIINDIKIEPSSNKNNL